MKAVFGILVVAVFLSVVSGTLRPQKPRPPYINRPTLPKPRFRRSASPGDHGSISISGNKPLSGPERRPSYNVDYQHNIWQGKNGQITAGGGAVKNPGQRWQPQVGIQGHWRFGRSANPGDNGSISISGNKPLSGPERRPSYNIDYQHNIWKGKNGQITAGGGAVKNPGQKWQPQVGVQGHWRF